MKIGGFKISKKVLLVIVGVVLVIIISSVVSSNKEDAEIEARLKAQEELNKQEESDGNVSNDMLSYEDQLQEELVEQFGTPPEGFKWDIMGELVAISSDDMSAEDVLFTFIRSISIMDFATAQRYSATSRIYNKYTSYFDEVTTSITNYYQQFLRKQYSFALKSIENLGVEGVATLADGTQVMSVKLRLLDLTDKDFWLVDKDEIYKQMRLFSDQEADDTKKEQYLYDYIYKAYESGKVGKREVVIDLKIAKQANGGFLLADDSELNAYLSYEDGLDLARYILDCYNDWHLETILKEQDELLNKELQKGEGDN